MPDNGHIGVLKISGAKAGKVTFIFPEEAYDSSSRYAIKKSWMVNHIHEYLYLDKENDKVFIKENESILPLI